MTGTPASPGPARREDGEQTRERLLNAAEELFAERGYHATAIRDIVDRAGCNLAAVNYHFQGKENLYRAVMRRLVAAFRDVLLGRMRATTHVSDGPPQLEAVLASYAQGFIEPLANRSSSRNLLQLFSRELLDPHLSPEILLRELVLPVQDELVRAIDGAFPGIAAADLRVSAQLFVAQVGHLLRMESYFGAETCSEIPFSVSTEAVDRIVRFTVAGIRSFRSTAERTLPLPAKEKE